MVIILAFQVPSSTGNIINVVYHNMQWRCCSYYVCFQSLFLTSHAKRRFQAFIIFKGKEFLKIHFRGWSNKWDEDIGDPKVESRLRPRTESTAVGVEFSFESFDDVARTYNCRKFSYRAEAPSSPRGAVETPDSRDPHFFATSGTRFPCEEIDACDAAGQWYPRVLF